jgi:hypothetical protein
LEYVSLIAGVRAIYLLTLAVILALLLLLQRPGVSRAALGRAS